VSNGSSGNSIQLVKTSTEKSLQFNTETGYTTISYNKDGTIQAGHGSTQFATNLILDSSDDDYEWLINNWFYAKVCDGSTCPATDANMDNICDDCGMMFAVLRDYDIWPDPYSVWTEARQVTFPYCMMYEDVDGNKFLVMSATRPYMQDGGVIIIPDSTTETTYVRYSIFGTEWRLNNSYAEGTGIDWGETYTSFNMFDQYDEQLMIPQDTDFFPIPLWMIPSQVTQGKMVALSVAGTMKVLTLCGVGLMACLMGYVLFGKVLRIFRR
jgi:hypothetical protein